MASATSDLATLKIRYAHALLERAGEENVKLEQVESDCNDLLAMLEGSQDLRLVARNPRIRMHDKTQAFVSVCEKAGLSDLMRRFVGVLGQNGRLYVIEDLLRAVVEEISSRRGERSADVTVAQPMDADQYQAIQDVLSKALGTSVNINVRRDPEILGGLIVKLGSFMVDDSVRTKLERLRRSMKQSRTHSRTNQEVA